MVSVFSSVINLLGETEWGIVPLGLAVMGTGNFFVECLKISAEKPYVRHVVLGKGD